MPNGTIDILDAPRAYARNRTILEYCRMKVHFSDWCDWADWRKTFASKLREPGVYLIARDVPCRTRADPLSSGIIYIGETSDTLRKRLSAFETACRCYYGSHAGGNSLFKAEIFPEFQQTRDGLVNQYGKERAKQEMRKLLTGRKKELDKKWTSVCNDLSVAIWVSSDGLTSKFKNLAVEHVPKFVEVNLQAEYWISNKRLPVYNKQIG